MQPKNTIAISVRFTRPDEVKEVLELSEKLQQWKQRAIYLAGLRHLDHIINKAKALVK